MERHNCGQTVTVGSVLVNLLTLNGMGVRQWESINVTNLLNNDMSDESFTQNFVEIIAEQIHPMPRGTLG